MNVTPLPRSCRPLFSLFPSSEDTAAAEGDAGDDASAGGSGSKEGAAGAAGEEATPKKK